MYIPTRFSLVAMIAVSAFNRTCGSNQTHDSSDASCVAPDGSTEAFPSGATVVDDATFEALLATGGAHSASAEQQQMDDAAAAQIDAANHATVDDFLAANAADPAITQWGTMLAAVPDPADPNVVADPDGYQVTMAGRSGPFTIRTLGTSAKYATAAAMLRGLASRDNQIATYSIVTAGLPATLRDSLSLPPPDALATMTDMQIQDTLAHVAQNYSAIYAALLPPAGTVAPLRGCDADFGRGKLSDRYGFHDHATIDACDAPSATGIIGNFDFPGKSDLSCVKDQGSRGTCWAFANTSLVEQLDSYKYGSRLNYSEQDLINRVKLTWWPSTIGDSAGLDIIPRMIDMHYRPVFENAWSYNPSPSRTYDSSANALHHSCVSYYEDCSDTNHQSRLYCPQSGFQACAYFGHDNPDTTNAPTSASYIFYPGQFLQTLGLVVTALSTVRPVTLMFEVYPAFENAYTDGWVRFNPSSPGQSVGQHAVHVVGFLDNTTLAARLPSAPAGGGGGYVIVKNSWGVCAGDAGYYYMPLDYLQYSAVGIQVLGDIE